jgi:hypothetical protein
MLDSCAREHRYELWYDRFQRVSGVGLGGLLAALSAAAALLTLGGGDHRHPEEAAASKVSSQVLATRVFQYLNLHFFYCAI